MENYSYLMDGQSFSEEANTVAEKKLENEVTAEDTNKRPSYPRFFKHVLDCLDDGKYPHKLYYVPDSNNKLFEVIYIDEKSKKLWTPYWNSLFKDCDEFFEEAYNRKHKSSSKAGFRAKMQKCLNKYVELISDEKDAKDKCKRVTRYKILKIPEIFDADKAASSGRKKSKRKRDNIEIKSPRKRKRNDSTKDKPPESSAHVFQEDNNKIVPYGDKKDSLIKSNYLCLSNSQINIPITLCVTLPGHADAYKTMPNGNLPIQVAAHTPAGTLKPAICITNTGNGFVPILRPPLSLPAVPGVLNTIIITGAVIPSTVSNDVHMIMATNSLHRDGSTSEINGAVIPSTVSNDVHMMMATLPRQADAHEIVNNELNGEDQDYFYGLDDSTVEAARRLDECLKSDIVWNSDSSSESQRSPNTSNGLYEDFWKIYGLEDILKEYDGGGFDTTKIEDRPLESDIIFKPDLSSEVERSPTTSDDLGDFQDWSLDFQELSDLANQLNSSTE